MMSNMEVRVLESAVMKKNEFWSLFSYELASEEHTF